MVAVEEFDDVKTAFIYIEMYVSGLEIRSAGLPYPGLRIKSLELTPGGITDPFTVCSRSDKQ